MNVINKIFDLISKKQKVQLISILFISVMSSILQVVSIASFAPFIALLAKPELADENVVFQTLSEYFGISGYYEMILYSGLGVLAILVISNITLTLTVWLVDKYSFAFGVVLSNSLFKTYLSQPYIYFLNNNSAELTKNIMSEVSRVVTGIMVPLLMGITKVVTALFLVLMLVVIDPVVALTAMVFLGAVYFLISIAIRRKLTNNGRILSEISMMRFKLVSEAFGGIKDTKIMGRDAFFYNNHKDLTQRVLPLEVFAGTASKIPRYIIETLVFGAMLLFVIGMVHMGQDILKILPLISLYALAGYRLVPAMQEAFTNFSRIRYALPALDIIHDDILRLRVKDGLPGRDPGHPSAGFERIEVRQLCYKYPNTDRYAVNGVDLTITAKTAIGVVGSSGSGKSTFIDILLGLLKLESGTISIDGEVVAADNFRVLQDMVGYVPQSIFLSDASISENIAFGIEPKLIDNERVRRVARLARIDQLIEQELPDGYNTLVGDRGARLSGGQRQRIGIARALYADPKILVLDEATSALDSITEKEIMDSIYELSKNVTIIMIAHRLSTIKHCDNIAVFDAGTVVAQGSYETLLVSSGKFNELVRVQEGDTSSVWSGKDQTTI